MKCFYCVAILGKIIIYNSKLRVNLRIGACDKEARKHKMLCRLFSRAAVSSECLRSIRGSTLPVTSVCERSKL